MTIYNKEKLVYPLRLSPKLSPIPDFVGLIDWLPSSSTSFLTASDMRPLLMPCLACCSFQKLDMTSETGGNSLLYTAGLSLSLLSQISVKDSTYM
jgi:hypothetical protein